MDLCRTLTLAVGSAVALSIASPSLAGASTFTRVPGPSGEDITALDWPATDRLLVGTGGGRIFTRTPDGSYTAATDAATGQALQTGVAFNEIASGPDASANVVYAAGQGDNLWRSLDGGRSFKRISGLTVASSCDPGDPSMHPIEAQDFLSIAWSGPGTVYAGSGNGGLYRSSAPAAASPQFSEINIKPGSQPCPVMQGALGGFRAAQFADLAFPIASQPAFGYAAVEGGCSNLYRTADGFASAPTLVSSDWSCVAARDQRFAVSTVNTSTLWSVADDGCLERSADGGRTFSQVRVIDENGAPTFNACMTGDAIAYRDGSLVVAGGGGPAGSIVTSPDADAANGGDYLQQDVGNDAVGWLSAAAADAAHGAVGGKGGALAITDKLNALPQPATTPPPPSPPPPPSTAKVTIPSSVTVGRNGSLSLKLACPAGGAACSARVTVTVTEKVRRHRRRRTVARIVASHSFVVPAGKTATLRLRLSRYGRSLLSHHRRLRATIFVRSRVGTAAATTSRRKVTLRAAGRPRER